MKEQTENEQAFLTLVKEYRRLIYKVCYLYATDEDHFKDLHQEVLINLWQGLRIRRRIKKEIKEMRDALQDELN